MSPENSAPAVVQNRHRIVGNFSCGAASAVAIKLAIAQYGQTHEIAIINAFLFRELDDNRRFAADCERWFGIPITVLRDEKYDADPIKVFLKKRFIKSFSGAPCSRELKRNLLDRFKKPGDIMVLGYTAEEEDRFEDFRDRNPDRPVVAPLVERGLGKGDCKAMVERAGILLPLSYRLGYDNANCKCCVKGGEAYMRACREDFPEDFEELCRVEDLLGSSSYLFRNRKTGERFSLRQLGKGPVRRNEKLPSCSFFCEMAEKEYVS